MLQNPLQSQDWKEIQDEVLKKARLINTVIPVGVPNLIESLEYYLRIPYDSKQFYVDLQQILDTYVAAHENTQNLQIHKNVELIKSLLPAIQADLLGHVLRQKGAEITEIDALKQHMVFMLHGAPPQMSIMKILCIISTSQIRREAVLELRVWNIQLRQWEFIPGYRRIVQKITEGKQRLVYAETAWQMLHLTSDQEELITNASAPV